MKDAEAPPEPDYALCNQGHSLQLVENERGQLTWDCPTCIRKMKEDREAAE